ncbi:MAG: hypothetical protein E7384_00870 [Ruminococcaceae bacterium]|nr:hypothetical protein [Oscillospiraceae bacterium]
MKISVTFKKILILCIAAIIVFTATAPCKIHSDAAEGNLIIMLDPGHGGEDGGAENTVDGVYYNENKLMLKVANYAKAELTQYPGVTVLLTRENNDTYLTLAERVSKATANGAHTIISLHANSYSGSSANGAEALVSYGSYRPTVAAASRSIGTKILSELASLGIKNRGLIKKFDNQGEIIEYYPDGSLQDYYGIVQRAIRGGIPGVIIETAFISNSSDVRKFFSSDEKLESLGKAIATGIANHYGLSKSSTASAPQRPHIDARELTFDSNPDTSFLYPLKGTKVTQSDGYATLTKGSDGIKVYIDYRGMAFSAETYKYALIKLKSSSIGAITTINTGAYKVTYDTDAFTYKATLDTEYKNILLDMSESEDWEMAVNFVKIQIFGADSADIESIKFYSSKPSAENTVTAIRPTPKPTQKPTAKPTQKPTSVPTQNSTAIQTEVPPTDITPSIAPTGSPIQAPSVQTENPVQSPAQPGPTNSAKPKGATQKSSKTVLVIVISILILVPATALFIAILLKQLKKNE